MSPSPEAGMPKTPPVTVDIIIRHAGGIVLIRRKYPPFQDRWCLPGGFVEFGETVEQAAIREAREETGLDVVLTRLVGVFSDPARDPRGHTVSLCFLAQSRGGVFGAADDALGAQLFTTIQPAELGFDHARMCAEAGVLGLGDADSDTMLN